MKNVSRIAIASFIGCLSVLVCSLCYGQQQISLKDVRKILVHTSAGGLGGDIAVDFEVLPEHGRWNSYQTDSLVTEEIELNKAKSSFLRKFVTTVPAEVVTAFIKGLNINQPQFNWKSFGITPSALKTGLQPAKPALPGTPNIDSLLTDAAIADALSALNKAGGWMDYGIYCTINIITAKGSIIGMDTRNYGIGLLPWTIDEHKTYDMGITNFFNAAMGKGNYPNKRSFNDYKELVWEKLERNGPLYQYRWNYGYTKNMAFLKQNFSISKVTFNLLSPPETDSTVWCDLSSSDLSFNTIIRAKVDIADTNCIAQLIVFKKIAAELEKGNNFLFNFYCGKPDIQIVFSIPEKVSNLYIPSQDWAAMQLIPGIDKTVLNKIIPLSVHTPAGESDWGIMPDDKVMLLYISENATTSAIPGIIRNIDLPAFHTTRHYALFDADGKQLK